MRAFIGVDISKLTIDLVLIHPSGQNYSCKIENSEEAVLEVLATLKRRTWLSKQGGGGYGRRYLSFSQNLVDLQPTRLAPQLQIKSNLIEKRVTSYQLIKP